MRSSRRRKRRPKMKSSYFPNDDGDNEDDDDVDDDDDDETDCISHLAGGRDVWDHFEANERVKQADAAQTSVAASTVALVPGESIAAGSVVGVGVSNAAAATSRQPGSKAMIPSPPLHRDQWQGQRQRFEQGIGRTMTAQNITATTHRTPPALTPLFWTGSSEGGRGSYNNNGCINRTSPSPYLAYQTPTNTTTMMTNPHVRVRTSSHATASGAPIVVGSGATTTASYNNLSSANPYDFVSACGNNFIDPCHQQQRLMPACSGPQHDVSKTKTPMVDWMHMMTNARQRQIWAHQRGGDINAPPRGTMERSLHCGGVSDRVGVSSLQEASFCVGPLKHCRDAHQVVATGVPMVSGGIAASGGSAIHNMLAEHSAYITHLASTRVDKGRQLQSMGGKNFHENDPLPSPRLVRPVPTLCWTPSPRGNDSLRGDGSPSAFNKRNVPADNPVVNKSKMTVSTVTPLVEKDNDNVAPKQCNSSSVLKSRRNANPRQWIPNDSHPNHRDCLTVDEFDLPHKQRKRQESSRQQQNLHNCIDGVFHDVSSPLPPPPPPTETPTSSPALPSSEEEVEGHCTHQTPRKMHITQTSPKQRGQRGSIVENENNNPNHLNGLQFGTGRGNGSGHIQPRLGNGRQSKTSGRRKTVSSCNGNAGALNERERDVVSLVAATGASPASSSVLDGGVTSKSSSLPVRNDTRLNVAVTGSLWSRQTAADNTMPTSTSMVNYGEKVKRKCETQNRSRSIRTSTSTSSKNAENTASTLEAAVHPFVMTPRTILPRLIVSFCDHEKDKFNMASNSGFRLTRNIPNIITNIVDGERLPTDDDDSRVDYVVLPFVLGMKEQRAPSYSTSHGRRKRRNTERLAVTGKSHQKDSSSGECTPTGDNNPYVLSIRLSVSGDDVTLLQGPKDDRREKLKKDCSNLLTAHYGFPIFLYHRQRTGALSSAMGPSGNDTIDSEEEKDWVNATRKRYEEMLSLHWGRLNSQSFHVVFDATNVHERRLRHDNPGVSSLCSLLDHHGHDYQPMMQSTPIVVQKVVFLPYPKAGASLTHFLPLLSMELKPLSVSTGETEIRAKKAVTDPVKMSKQDTKQEKDGSFSKLTVSMQVEALAIQPPSVCFNFPLFPDQKVSCFSRKSQQDELSQLHNSYLPSFHLIPIPDSYYVISKVHDDIDKASSRCCTSVPPLVLTTEQILQTLNASSSSLHGDSTGEDGDFPLSGFLQFDELDESDGKDDYHHVGKSYRTACAAIKNGSLANHRPPPTTTGAWIALNTTMTSVTEHCSRCREDEPAIPTEVDAFTSNEIIARNAFVYAACVRYYHYHYHGGGANAALWRGEEERYKEKQRIRSSCKEEQATIKDDFCFLLVVVFLTSSSTSRSQICHDCNDSSEQRNEKSKSEKHRDDKNKKKKIAYQSEERQHAHGKTKSSFSVRLFRVVVAPLDDVRHCSLHVDAVRRNENVGGTEQTPLSSRQEQIARNEAPASRSTKDDCPNDAFSSSKKQAPILECKIDFAVPLKCRPSCFDKTPGMFSSGKRNKQGTPRRCTSGSAVTLSAQLEKDDNDSNGDDWGEVTIERKKERKKKQQDERTSSLKDKILCPFRHVHDKDPRVSILESTIVNSINMLSLEEEKMATEQQQQLQKHQEEYRQREAPTTSSSTDLPVGEDSSGTTQSIASNRKFSHSLNPSLCPHGDRSNMSEQTISKASAPAQPVRNESDTKTTISTCCACENGTSQIQSNLIIQEQQKKLEKLQRQVMELTLLVEQQQQQQQEQQHHRTYCTIHARHTDGTQSDQRVELNEKGSSQGKDNTSANISNDQVTGNDVNRRWQTNGYITEKQTKSVSASMAHRLASPSKAHEGGEENIEVIMGEKGAGSAPQMAGRNQDSTPNSIRRETFQRGQRDATKVLVETKMKEYHDEKEHRRPFRGSNDEEMLMHSFVPPKTIPNNRGDKGECIMNHYNAPCVPQFVAKERNITEAHNQPFATTDTCSFALSGFESNVADCDDTTVSFGGSASEAIATGTQHATRLLTQEMSNDDKKVFSVSPNRISGSFSSSVMRNYDDSISRADDDTNSTETEDEFDDDCSLIRRIEAKYLGNA